MDLEKYKTICNEEFTSYRFTSVGEKGEIEKLVIFQSTTVSDLYNLAFGDFKENTGEIDDKSVSNNGDMKKVLATIVSIIFAYTKKYPNHTVLIMGSSESRTRLYRIGINLYFDEFSKEFEISGLIAGGFRESFVKNKSYIGYLVERK